MGVTTIGGLYVIPGVEPICMLRGLLFGHAVGGGGVYVITAVDIRVREN